MRLDLCVYRKWSCAKKKKKAKRPFLGSKDSLVSGSVFSVCKYVHICIYVCIYVYMFIFIHVRVQFTDFFVEKKKK
jgi:hypothetical protein